MEFHRARIIHWASAARRGVNELVLLARFATSTTHTWTSLLCRVLFFFCLIRDDKESRPVRWVVCGGETAETKFTIIKSSAVVLRNPTLLLRSSANCCLLWHSITLSLLSTFRNQTLLAERNRRQSPSFPHSTSFLLNHQTKQSTSRTLTNLFPFVWARDVIFVFKKPPKRKYPGKQEPSNADWEEKNFPRFVLGFRHRCDRNMDSLRKRKEMKFSERWGVNDVVSHCSFELLWVLKAFRLD